MEVKRPSMKNLLNNLKNIFYLFTGTFKNGLQENKPEQKQYFQIDI
jgi:hypothetical protein